MRRRGGLRGGSSEGVVTLLAVLRAGAAYLPVDPEYPPDRVAFMLADAAPVLAVAQAGTAGLVPGGVTTVVLDEPAVIAAVAARAPAGPCPGLRGGHPAYVIYTSGSTGRPKGVAVTQAGIANRLAWMQGEYRLGPADRGVQKNPSGFGVSGWEFFL